MNSQINPWKRDYARKAPWTFWQISSVVGMSLILMAVAYGFYWLFK